MLTLTPSYGDSRESVKTVVKKKDYKPILREILGLREQVGIPKGILMLALGTDPSQFKRWEDRLDDDDPWYPNQDTRDAIESLTRPEGDWWKGTLAWSASRMESTVGDLKQAAQAREELRSRLDLTPPPEGQAVPGKEAAEASGASGEPETIDPTDGDEYETGTG